MTHEPIPFKIRGSFGWTKLPGFTRQLHAISTADSDRFVLDLSELAFCEPVALTCLASGMHYLRLREQECIEVIRPEAGEVRLYLERLGLFDMLGEEDLYPYQRHDPSGRFVELTRVSAAAQVAKATTAICEVICGNLGLTGKARNAVDTILSEVTENVFHHAHSPTGAYLCCQSYKNKLSAAIVDLGDGVRRRLSDTEGLQKIVEEHGGPLQAAIAPKVTSRPAHNSGYGLALTSGLVVQNSGMLGIHSQRDRLTQTGEKISEYNSEERWPGTVICLTLYRDRTLDSGLLYDTVWPPEDDDDFDFLNE